jgi:hypothetical protein
LKVESEWRLAQDSTIVRTWGAACCARTNSSKELRD